MLKRLSKYGNSLALIIPKPVLDLLAIDADTSLDITTDGSSLTVTPVRDPKMQEEFEKASADTLARYREVFRGLSN